MKYKNYTVTYDNNYLSTSMLNDAVMTNPSNYGANVEAFGGVVSNTQVDFAGVVLEFTAPATYTTSGRGPYIYPGTSLTVGQTYTWEMYVKTSSNKTLTMGYEKPGGYTTYNITTSWQKISCTFTVGSGGYEAFIWYNASGVTWNAGDKLYICGIRLEAGNGSSSKSSSSKTYGTALGTLASPTRTGYTFNGWFTDPVGGTQISSTTTVPANNVTYYAHWTSASGASLSAMSLSSFSLEASTENDSFNDNDTILPTKEEKTVKIKEKTTGDGNGVGPDPNKTSENNKQDIKPAIDNIEKIDENDIDEEKEEQIENIEDEEQENSQDSEEKENIFDEDSLFGESNKMDMLMVKTAEKKTKEEEEDDEKEEKDAEAEEKKDKKEEELQKLKEEILDLKDQI